MNSSGLHAAISRSKGTTRTASTPPSTSSRSPRVDRGQRRRRMLGPEHRDGVGVEGDRRRPCPTPSSSAVVARPLQDVLVPEVDPVEVADRDDGRPGPPGPRRTTPDLHGAQTTPASADEDGDGRAPRRRGARRAPGTPRRARTGRARPRPGARARGAADPDVGGLVLVEVDAREGRPGSIGDRDQPNSSSSCRGWGAREVEGAHRRTAQRGQVAAHAERRAEVAGDRADVGAAGAAHRDPTSGQRPSRCTSLVDR